MTEESEYLQSDDDVEEILRLAVRRTGPEGQSLRERLLASANELGISATQLAEAERQWRDAKQGKLDEENERRLRRQFRKIRVSDFVKHLASYVAVCTFLAWIDMSGNGRLDWALWVILAWGIGIFTHFASVLVHGADEERDFQKWIRKRDWRHGLAVGVKVGTGEHED